MVGWADVTNHFLTNNCWGAWIGSWFVNDEQWAELPDPLKELWMASIGAGYDYRNQWYWGGEAGLRATGDKLKLTAIPADQWATVEEAALKFWDEVAAESEEKAKVVKVFRSNAAPEEGRRSTLRRWSFTRASRLSAVDPDVCRVRLLRRGEAGVMMGRLEERGGHHFRWRNGHRRRRVSTLPREGLESPITGRDEAAAERNRALTSPLPVAGPPSSRLMCPMEEQVNAAVRRRNDSFGTITTLFNHAGTIVVKTFSGDDARRVGGGGSRQRAFR